ncbi:MAG: hypothetical protein AAGC88_17535, partial [Bacteroidota bacterium]
FHRGGIITKCLEGQYRVVPKPSALKAKVVDANNKKVRAEEDDCFGFAFDNELYIRFLDGFYPLVREENGFFFIGPKEANFNAVTRGTYHHGILGGLLSTAFSGGNVLYALDVGTGQILRVKTL